MSHENVDSTTIGNVTQQLRAEEGRLLAEKGELESRTKGVEAELRRVRAALGALTPKGRATSPTAAVGGAALTTQEVIGMIEPLLEGGGRVEIDELRRQVEQRAKAGGRSLIGFHLRFKKAMKDSRFAVEGGVCHLSSSGLFALRGESRE